MYKHKRVAVATVESEEYVKRTRGDFRYNQPTDIKPELVAFRTAIENKYIRTMHRSANTAYVYIEGEQMVLGWIGYGDFQSTVTGEDKYVVYARNIRNMRHTQGSDEHYMRSALRLDKAIKNCNASLIRYTSEETGCALTGLPKREFAGLSREADEAYMEVRRNIGLMDRTNTELALELITLIQDGYVFRQPELHENISKLSHLKDQYNKHSSNNPRPMDFVRIYKNPREELRADVVKITNVNAYNSWGGNEKPIADRVSGKDMYLTEALPENILGKIAVMTMCEDGQFVEDVGYKVDDTMFYFYPEEPTT